MRICLTLLFLLSIHSFAEPKKYVYVLVVGPRPATAYSNPTSELEALKKLMLDEVKPAIEAFPRHSEVHALSGFHIDELADLSHILSGRNDVHRVSWIIVAHGKPEKDFDSRNSASEIRISLPGIASSGLTNRPGDPRDYRDDYHVLTDEGWKSGLELGRALHTRHSTHTALLTCYSGACNTSYFPGPVFGISPHHRTQEAFVVRHYLHKLDDQSILPLPSSAEEFYQRWLYSAGVYDIDAWWGPASTEKGHTGTKTFWDRLQVNLGPPRDTRPPLSKDTCIDPLTKLANPHHIHTQ